MPAILPLFISDLENYCERQSLRWITDSEWTSNRMTKITSFARYLRNEKLAYPLAFAISSEIDRRALRLIVAEEKEDTKVEAK